MTENGNQTPQIIASSYEIIREIGSGGGGVVYLGRHLRLGKLVVLKADKHKLTAKPETLRREVDALKNLSHTYIPQVYDFVTENDIVYTVMDYIEGESLDKPLRRGERFSQAEVIRWAKQLLQALSYLHSRPPHGILHSDIKPANIMLTPQGDICLIDFNIALALGEEGAVRVGFSRGYASPEHYGVDYAAISRTQTEKTAQTQLLTDPGRTQLEQGANASSSRSGRSVLLDTRSDIYSLGATLYHLLTGRRPSQEAKQVTPICEPGISPSVAAIVQKAMSPNPNDRYQSAEQMLNAFMHLRENDPRTKRHRRWITASVAVLTALFLAGGAAALLGSRQMEQQQQQARLEAEAAEDAQREKKLAAQKAQKAAQREEQALALITQAEQAYAQGDLSTAKAAALQALELDTAYTPQAQNALTAALGVYDLSDGFHAHGLLALPGEPLKAVLSPQGTRVAVMTNGTLSVFDTQSGELLTTLDAASSALSDVVFIDEQTLLYAGETALLAYDLVEEYVLWSAKAATGITLSADGTTAAAVHTDENLAAVYDVQTGAALRTVTFQQRWQAVVENDVFADPGDNLFVLNADGSLLAVSFADGALKLFDLRGGENLTIYDESAFVHFEGGFFGQYFAFSATGDDQSVFAVIDTQQRVQTGGFSSTMPFHVQADENGICVSAENVLVQLDPVSGEQTELAYTQTDITGFARAGGYVVTATADGAITFFDATAKQLQRFEAEQQSDFVGIAGAFAFAADRNTQALRLMKRENHADAQLATYDARYDHSEARLSADGSTVMLFRYDGFRLYTPDGALLTEVSIPDPEQVYDQQYRRDADGSRLEVYYNSGLVLSYSATDGTLLEQRTEEAPDGTLDEEFYTDTLKIVSPLHGTPQVYDRATGELLCELEQDAYLSYVTQVGPYLVTQYVTTQAEYYALLLDEACRTLAVLPNLCDVTADGRLIFDDMSGNLRQSRIYSIDELKALTNEQEEKV